MNFKDESYPQQFLNSRSVLCKQTECYPEFPERRERSPPRNGDGQEFQRLGCHPGHVIDSFYDNEQAIEYFQGSDSWSIKLEEWIKRSQVHARPKFSDFKDNCFNIWALPKTDDTEPDSQGSTVVAEKIFASSLSNTMGWVWKKTGNACPVWYARGPLKWKETRVSWVPTKRSISSTNTDQPYSALLLRLSIFLCCSTEPIIYLTQVGRFQKPFQNGSIEYVLLLIWVIPRYQRSWFFSYRRFKAAEGKSSEPYNTNRG